MKVTLLVITLCTFIIFVQNVTATDTNTNAETNGTQNGHDSITETAGKDIAYGYAKNWSNDAKLIRITIPTSEIVGNEGKIEYYTTEYCYIFRSDDKYLGVLVNITDYEKGTARTEERSREEGEKLGLNNKKPLPDMWKVVSWNAFKIASNSYNMSSERGDIISRMCFEATELNDSIIPVWNISIRNGITGIDTNYTINANTGDILYPKLNVEPPTVPSETTSIPKTTDTPIEKETPLWRDPVIIAAVIGAVALIVSSYKKQK